MFVRIPEPGLVLMLQRVYDRRPAHNLVCGGAHQILVNVASSLKVRIFGTYRRDREANVVRKYLQTVGLLDACRYNKIVAFGNDGC